ncbi:tail length tape measure protein [Bacillus mycoides]|uniref:phage tail protein n=1 Tax=Bacillus mycoides TaxID=1405 RepID=UPI002E22FF92|nr:tail length tape measure protein [Bacillus mycoides]MED1054368.1 tail length tape measure protein [Bacillus mycoides]
MADGRVEIETRLDRSNLRRDVQQVNRELEQVGNNMGQAGREANREMASQLRDTSSQARRAYDDMAQSAARSGNATRAAANATVEANRRSVDSSRQSAQARHAEAEAVRHMADVTESSNGRATRSYYNSRREQQALYSSMTQKQREMYTEMKQGYMQQHQAMMKQKGAMVEVQYGYFKLAQSSKDYAGSTKQFMSEVQALGKAQKKAADDAINANRLAMMGMLQQIGYMQNMTTQATRISENYKRMANPLYTINSAGLKAADALNRMANAGNASVLALKMLGPTAKMKDLQNMTMMITQGLMRFNMIALAAAATSAILYASLFKAAKGPDPSEVYKKQEEALTAYRDAVKKRTEEIATAWGLFEEVQMKKTSGKQLIKNLEEQVGIMERWRGNLAKIAERAGTEFSNYLSNMGPQAAEEVKAISEMSDPELSKYVNLWKRKMQEARGQALTELQGLKEETDKKIKELQDSLTPLGLAWERMKGAFVTAIQPMVDAFGLLMTPLVNFAAKFFELVTLFNQAHPTLALIIQAIIMLVPALTLILSPLAIGIGLWNGMLAAWSSIWMLIGPLITGLMAMSATVWVVSAAIVGLVAGIVYLWNTNEGFRNAVIAAWEAIKQTAITVWNFILNSVLIPVWSAMTSYFQEVLQKIQSWWTENGDMIMQAASNVWNFVLSIIQTVMPIIMSIMQVMWPIIKEIVIGTWEAIKNVINGALNIIMGIVNFFSALFTGNWGKMWDAVKQIWNGALELLWGWLQLWGAGRILKWLGKFAGDIVKPFIKFWDDIKRVWNNALAEIYVFFGSKLESITAFVRSWGGMAKNVFDGIWSAIVNGVSNKLNGIVTGVEMILNKVVSFITNMGKTFFNAGRGLIEMMAKGIKSAASWVTDAVSDLAQKARDFLPFSPAKTGPLSDLDHLDFGGPITDSIKLAFPQVGGLMSDLLDLPPILPSIQQNSVVEAKTAKKDNSTTESNGSAPTYIVMDKKIVGEVLAQPVENTNNRRKQRLAQFKPTVTPSF